MKVSDVGDRVYLIVNRDQRLMVLPGCLIETQKSLVAHVVDNDVDAAPSRHRIRDELFRGFGVRNIAGVGAGSNSRRLDLPDHRARDRRVAVLAGDRRKSHVIDDDPRSATRKLQRVAAA